MTMFREYEFQYKGFNFVSSVAVDSPMYQRIKSVPESVFIQMNLQCLEELLGSTPLNVNSINDRLKEMNAGGSQAFIALGVNN
jgi:hypothetical protein